MLTSRVITTLCGGKGFIIPNRPALIRDGVQFTRNDNRKNLYPPRYWYQQALDLFTEDVLIYTHDDLIIHDTNWHARVMQQFNYDVVAVGFGGARSLGHPSLYKRPYKLPDMARGGYMSNQTDGQVHGTVTTDDHYVAVLDAFFMAVRRDFLVEVGGWPIELTHHCLDLWLACEAAKHKHNIMMVGASCTHLGGGTSIKKQYSDATWLQDGSLDTEHTNPHRWLYDKYIGVLPISLPPEQSTMGMLPPTIGPLVTPFTSDNT